MKIVGLTLNAHDSNWYDGELHYQAERYTRKKKNIYKGDRQYFYLDHVKHRLLDKNIISALSYTNGGIKDGVFLVEDPMETVLKDHYPKIRKFNEDFTHLWDYYLEDNLYYINHHQSHAAYTFLASQYDNSDILAIDGGGIGYNTIFFDKDGLKHNLSDKIPLGWLWNVSCAFTGYSTRESGKLMGLSGYGKFSEKYYFILEMLVDHFVEYGKSHSIGERWYKQSGYIDPKDVAFTMQQFTLDKVREFVLPLKTSDNLCIAGGVAYNGYMNELFTKHYHNVYVPPAPGDEGQAIGNYMHADYVLNGNIHIPNVYNGKEHPVAVSIFDGLDYEYMDFDSLTNRVAQAIADGAIVGWYQGKSESGNRALGNRSILADPRNPNIKDIINHTIKFREDFRPFAPSVLIEEYQNYFDTNQPSPHMSRIMPVISDKIPGVTHVDGTARIQTVDKEMNPRYHQLISSFHTITGIPMLVNTSFNCQEPIVETPYDAVKTFKKTNLNMLVINNYVITKKYS